jgi:hypothetical protein
MSLDVSAATAILKQRYPDDKIITLGWRGSKLFSLLPKDSEGGGEKDKIPVEISGPQAVSATLSDAQTVAAASSAKYEAWEITTVDAYSLARVSGKAVKAMRNDAVAFARAMGSQIDGALKTATRHLNRHLYRTAGGGLATVNTSGLSTVYATLAETYAANMFEVGMEVVSAADEASALQTGSATITGVDRSGNRLITDANWTGQIVTIADGYKIFLLGDYKSASDVKCVTGLASWLPAVDPSPSENFFGVDRSVDRNRLAGVYYDANANSDNIEEAIINGCALGVTNGGMGETSGELVAVMHPKQYANLAKLLGSNVQYDKVVARGLDGELIADISWDAIRVHTLTGRTIKVVDDIDCPYNMAYILDLDSWKLLSLGGFPIILDFDDLKWLRVSNADEYEARGGGYVQAVCKNPSANVAIKVAA